MRSYNRVMNWHTGYAKGEASMKLKFEAAAKGGNEYIDILNAGLEVAVEDIGGEGNPASPFVKRISIANKTGDTWQGVIHTKYMFGRNKGASPENKKVMADPQFYMPGFMYGSNRGEAPLHVNAKFPRIRRGGLDKPASPWWMVRSDRLSHPAVFAYDNGLMYGIAAAPYFVRTGSGEVTPWSPGTDGDFVQYCGYTCSVEDGYIGYTIGYENAPWFFLQSHNVYDRKTIDDDNSYTIAAGETLSFDIMIFEYISKDEMELYNVLRYVYGMYHESPRSASDILTAVSDIAGAVDRDAWIAEDNAYTGFVFEGEDGSFSYNKIPSISWTNGMAVALPMLLASYRIGNETMREHALTFMQNMVDNSINPKSGLPFDSCNDGVWSNRGWWYESLRTPGHSSYLVGQAIYYLCKAYEYEKNVKFVIHDDWMDFAEDIVRRLAFTRNLDKEYPYMLSAETGAGIEYDSFAGAWCLAAIAYFSVLNDDITYLESLQESEKHYYDAYISKVSCYGAPLDTDKAVDSEGVLAYIRAMKHLHMMTGAEVYLDHMRDALSYEFTFKFCYNSPIKVPPLSKVGWSSCGGSITSTANPHIHPMSSTVADEMLYYTKHRDDDYVKSRLDDVLLWGCQTYNTFDKEYDYGLKGWMSERFCHSEGLLTEHYPDGSVSSTWFALMPWASGCILESLAGDCFNW